MIPREYICQEVSVLVVSASDLDPYIDLCAVHAVCRRPHFRGRIIRRPDASGHVICLDGTGGDPIDRKLSTCRQAKVSYLYVVYAISAAADEDVFWFQVTVNDVKPVNVGQAFQNLPKEAPYLGRVLA